MGKSSQEGKGAKVVYTIFAFLLSMLIFFFTLLVILQSTFLNKNFILNEINDTNYYTDLSSEITEGLHPINVIVFDDPKKSNLVAGFCLLYTSASTSVT